MNDQIVGGVLTWIPPGMMAAVAFLILLSRLVRQPGRAYPDTSSPESGV